MKDKMMLKPRLQVCADFVRTGKKTADIGTDHAYLPIYLLKTGKVPFAIACDVNQGPLDSGRANAESFAAADLLSFRLSDGLASVKEEEADDVVIAGMGGELILRIILETDWLFSPEKHLILQPMTKADLLRQKLYENGFQIVEEQAVLEDKKIYTVLSVCFCGEKTEISGIEKYMGRLKAGDEFAALYAQKILRSLHGKIIALQNQGIATADLVLLAEQIEKQYIIQG